MKKLLAVLLCLVQILVVPVQAVELSPRQFFDLYRLDIYEEKPSKSGVKWCSLREVKGQSVINFSDGAVLYHAYDDPSMNDDSLPASNIYMAFVDFCSAFDFDAYLFHDGKTRLVYAGKGIEIDKIFKLKPVDYTDERYDDKNEYITALENVIYKSGAYPSEEDIISDMSAAEDVRQKLNDATEKLARNDMLYGTKVERIEVNPNSGTPDGGDFIGLVYAVYDGFTTPKGDYNQILRAATNIPTIARSACPEIVEYCVFVELPAYNAQAKFQFLIEDDRINYGDVMVPKVMLQ